MLMFSWIKQFRMQLLATLSITLIGFTLVLSLVIWFKTSEYLKQEIGYELVETTRLMADKLDRYVWSRSAELALINGLETLRHPEDVEGIQQVLNQLHQFIPVFSWVGFIDPQGRVVAATSGMRVGEDLSRHRIFLNARHQRFFGGVQDLVSSPENSSFSSVAPTHLIGISYPVLDHDQKFSGVLAAYLSLDWVREIIDGLTIPLATHKNIEMYVISGPDNRVLIGPETEVGQPLHLQSIVLARGGDIGFRTETWPDGRIYLTSYVQSSGHQNYPGLEWVILLRQDLEKAYKPTRHMLGIIWLIGSVFGGLVLILSWMLAGRMARPLEQITLAARSMLDGSQRTLPRLKGYEEVEVLSNTLSTLVGQLIKAESSRDHLHRIAHHDALTGLPNRNAMNEFLARARQQSPGTSGNLTLMFMDLDRFKQVNDTYGHEVGDKLLQQVAGRLLPLLADNERQLLVRLGGDEFVFLLESELADPRAVFSRIAEQAIHQLNQEFIIDGKSVHIGCSLGGAVWPADDPDLQHVMVLADQALYRAKQQGRNQLVFHRTR
ncbi:sensor domain-containing diguanylate cyclase [Marinospirillum alkaliphilum]|uniref:Diguanylate cyclase (GGDEF) domain-containing protein n=1 Tax=Marinospirillum alkaliphilum DSM 21637 TaxID=1122209 RepID=A0A1K1X1B9_9GAMM|nr:sensor domain-containing diguanylate cyclase [Marinospirillum alkaliphilum]SFX42996.1 diguanylate cyclase (GGDEF) domain-containing protein [Marinospirillum alkaliphilum DSM 21637]